MSHKVMALVVFVLSCNGGPKEVDRESATVGEASKPAVRVATPPAAAPTGKPSGKTETAGALTGSASTTAESGSGSGSGSQGSAESVAAPAEVKVRLEQDRVTLDRIWHGQCGRVQEPKAWDEYLAWQEGLTPQERRPEHESYAKAVAVNPAIATLRAKIEVCGPRRGGASAPATSH